MFSHMFGLFKSPFIQIPLLAEKDSHQPVKERLFYFGINVIQVVSVVYCTAESTVK